MTGRSWILAIGMICALGGHPVDAQEASRPQVDYSAGKTPAQLFATDCSSCHKSPQGLARGKDQSSLASFLRAHYTTKPATAGALAAYLSSVGVGSGRAPAAADRRPERAEPAQRPRQAVPAGEARGGEDGAKPRAAIQPGGQSRDSAAPPRPPPRVPGDDAAGASAAAAPKPATARTSRVPRQTPAAAREAEEAKLKAYATSGDAAKPADDATKPAHAERRETDDGLTSYARSGADAQTSARDRRGEISVGGSATEETPAGDPRGSRSVQAPSDLPSSATPSDVTQSAPTEQTGALPSAAKSANQSPAPSTPAPADAPPSAASSPSVDH